MRCPDSAWLSVRRPTPQQKKHTRIQERRSGSGSRPQALRQIVNEACPWPTKQDQEYT
jgi:hypothetical protein